MSLASQVSDLASRIATEVKAKPGIGVAAVLAPSDPIPSGTPTGLIVRLAS